VGVPAILVMVSNFATIHAPRALKGGMRCGPTEGALVRGVIPYESCLYFRRGYRSRMLLNSASLSKANPLTNVSSLAVVV
jgi:hypothetical protein